MTTELGMTSLLDRATRGDAGAVNALLREYHDFVFAICRSVLKNETDAADATQDALVALVKSLTKFRGESSFKTWVYRIAKNTSLNHYKKRKRFLLRQADQRADEFDETLAGNSKPEDATVAQFEVNRLLADLPEEVRETVALRYIGGLEYQEIAEIQQVAVGTVSSRINRAKQMLISSALREEMTELEHLNG